MLQNDLPKNFWQNLSEYKMMHSRTKDVVSFFLFLLFRFYKATSSVVKNLDQASLFNILTDRNMSLKYAKCFCVDKTKYQDFVDDTKSDSG